MPKCQKTKLCKKTSVSEHKETKDYPESMKENTYNITSRYHNAVWQSGITCKLQHHVDKIPENEIVGNLEKVQTKW